MTKLLRLREIFMGNIDAKNELIGSNELETDRFLSGFLLPPTVVLDEIMSGEKYFVTGMKGIGKTCFLRYIDLQLKTHWQTRTQFFLFKSKFTEEDRRDFSRSANKPEIVSTEIQNRVDLSYETLWKWFIFKSLVSLIESTDLSPFEPDDNWKKFVVCMLSPLKDDEQSGIRRLLPKMDGDEVTMSSLPIDLDFDWENKEKRTISFGNLTKQADVLFSKLKPTSNRIALLFDELEIGIASAENRARDIALIRDLVVSVEQFNSMCRELGYNVRVIAAIRTEVLAAIESVGKEINKIVADFGVPIIWNIGGIGHLDHPLINIIIKRILFSEKIKGINLETNRIAVWDRYFPKIYQKKASQDYILGMTWLRPRDIVRLINIARTQFPESSDFHEHTIMASRKEYSRQSWIEITEELSTRYPKEDIEAIRILLSGGGRYFDSKQFEHHFQDMASQYKVVGNISQKLTSAQLITDLYNIGVLGNSNISYSSSKEKMNYRYYYKGDYHPIFENTFVVHNALCPFLGLN